jgi:hypothetical protein
VTTFRLRLTLLPEDHHQHIEIGSCDDSAVSYVTCVFAHKGLQCAPSITRKTNLLMKLPNFEGNNEREKQQ